MLFASLFEYLVDHAGFVSVVLDILTEAPRLVSLVCKAKLMLRAISSS